MAPRANWKGFLRLSLVTCPIALFPATSESEKISFNQINKKTGHRIRYLKVDSDTGEEVSNEDIIKGYQVDKDRYLEVTKDELENIALESTRTIEIDEFVPRSEIDDLYLVRPYYIVPDGKVGHDAFAVIRWSAAGISPVTASLLWSEAVAAEVLVFFVIGPALVPRLTAAGAAAGAALAGTLRWAVMAQTTDVLALALVQPLHGLTFALLHLACMRLIARTVPPGLEGTAQAIYGTVGVGAASALLTLVSGVLYARWGAQGFWVMAALSALAVPVTWKLRQYEFGESRSP